MLATASAVTGATPRWPESLRGAEKGGFAARRLTPSNALVREVVQLDSGPSDPLCANEHKTAAPQTLPRDEVQLTAAAKPVLADPKNLCVWVKDNGGMGTFYRSRRELIFAFKKGAAPHLNNFELGQHGRYRTNVWQYRGVNTLKTGRLDELSLHPLSQVHPQLPRR